MTLDTSRPLLLRALGRWSLVALTVNSILGSGIFGLPSALSNLIGAASPWAVVLTGVLMAVIVGCHAEIASQFKETGGTYLYVRHAFGRFAGVQTGWLILLGRLTGCAAGANLLVAYLAEFWPEATHPVPRAVVISVLLGALAFVNYRGVGAGAIVSNVSAVAKLLPLATICMVGVAYLLTHSGVATSAPRAETDRWLTAVLLLVFAYGGFESALSPMGEAQDPRRDAVFALFVGLATVAVLYTALQFTVVGVLAHPERSERPLADAAQALLGHPGAMLISAGALISVYGYLSANLLSAPRGAFALAERGDFPRWFAAVHRHFRTPHVAISVFALLLWAFALFGSFSWNVTLSAVARLFYYGAVCAAVPILRRRQPEAAAFRLPAGGVFAAVGVLTCAVLLTQVDFGKSLILVATLAAATLNWLVTRNRAASPAQVS
ncbi:MAG TPA: APC family permease [Steroidobacteraceae bacterium]|nr:APC family permease [Steroidobacteraceae bacterium]